MLMPIAAQFFDGYAVGMFRLTTMLLLAACTPAQVPLAKTGDAEKRMLICEYGLRVKQERALAVAVDLTP